MRSLGRHAQRGFSLIELLIALAIGLIMVAALGTLLVHAIGSRTELERANRQIENGRFAMQTLDQEVARAGFFGAYYSLTTPSAYVDPCSLTDTVVAAGINMPVQAFDGSGATASSPPISCLSGKNYQPGSDVLVVRRAESSSTTDTSSLDSDEPYVQSTVSGVVVKYGSSSSSFTLTDKNSGVADIRRLVQRIYYVSSKDDYGKDIPTLRVMELHKTAFTDQAIAEGIETLQLEFGLDSATASAQDGAPDGTYATSIACTSSSSAGCSDWARLVSVKVGLLARNSDTSKNYTDDKSYTLWSRSISAANDGYKRHAYVATVRVNSVSGRKEIP